MKRTSLVVVAASILIAALVSPAGAKGCLDIDPMPSGSGHSHDDRSQHEFVCGVKALASLDLLDVVPDAVYFGELDVAGSLAAQAIAYPRGGFVLFDIADPAKPKVLSRFDGPACDTTVRDYDCAADVKLSPDGQYAFLAIQRSIAPAPGGTERPELPTETGVITVDLSDPRAPRRVSFAPIGPRGSHMLALHQIAGKDWLFAIHNKEGFYIFERQGAQLRRVADIRTAGAHDFYVFDDPATKKTYLYVAAETAGMLVYDVTDPTHATRVGAWRPVPELQDEVWYMHSAWTFREGSKRFTLVDSELSSPGEDHGSLPAPIWLLDTTDFAAITVVGEWRNPGGYPAGHSRFSTHNFTVVDGVSWVANYHGGVWLLDWKPVANGSAARPTELGYFVPHEVARPSVEVNPQQRFLSAFEVDLRPSVWDVVTDGKFGYISDISGGFVVIEREATTPVRAPKRNNAWAYVGGAALMLVVAALFFSRRRARARRSLLGSS